MKFLWTTINVENLDESINFYSDLVELKVLKRIKDPDGLNVQFFQQK